MVESPIHILAKYYRLLRKENRLAKYLLFILMKIDGFVGILFILMPSLLIYQSGSSFVVLFIYCVFVRNQNLHLFFLWLSMRKGGWGLKIHYCRLLACIVPEKSLTKKLTLAYMERKKEVKRNKKNQKTKKNQEVICFLHDIINHC